jgi:hypothetical protein
MFLKMKFIMSQVSTEDFKIIFFSIYGRNLSFSISWLAFHPGTLGFGLLHFPVPLHCLDVYSWTQNSLLRRTMTSWRNFMD